MEKNKNAFFTKLYCWVYDINTDDLPDNTCSYYFNLLVAIFLFIPQQICLIPFYLRHGIVSNKTQDRAFQSIFILSVLVVIMLLMVLFSQIGIFHTMCVLVGFFIIYLHTFTNFPKVFKPYVFFKRKVCSKINWK